MKPDAPLTRRMLSALGVGPEAGLVALRTLKRVVILIVGGTVLALGVALIVLPGPAIVVIPAGLAILAVEFAWARRWLNRMREWVQRARGSASKGRGPTPDPGATANRP